MMIYAWLLLFVLAFYVGFVVCEKSKWVEEDTYMWGAIGIVVAVCLFVSLAGCTRAYVQDLPPCERGQRILDEHHPFYGGCLVELKDAGRR